MAWPWRPCRFHDNSDILLSLPLLAHGDAPVPAPPPFRWPTSRTPRFSLSVKKQVCDIVKKQLALADGTEVCGYSKFQDLGADSLDTVSELYITLFNYISHFNWTYFQVIVMGLEEAFGISVEESSAQSIATVEDAANLIDDLVAAKSS